MLGYLDGIVSIVDRLTVRMTADVPENDFDVVVPGKVVSILVYATHKTITGAITRRAPAADAATRTVHIEIDLPDPNPYKAWMRTTACPGPATGEATSSILALVLVMNLGEDCD